MGERGTHDHSARAGRTGGSIWSTGVGLLTRPTFWLVGIVATVATGFVTTQVTDLAKPVTTYVSERICDFRQGPIKPDDRKFIVLISRLAGDSDDTQTSRLIDAFRDESGFKTYQLCKSLTFNPLKEAGEAKAETISRGRDIITADHADLLLFGSVRQANRTLELYVINEHGDCSREPKAIILNDGLLSTEFNRSTKVDLITASLIEITSACEHDRPPDWGKFAVRLAKVEAFLRDSGSNLPLEKQFDVTSSIMTALLLLHENDFNNNWLEESRQIAQRSKPQFSENQQSQLWLRYAVMLYEKAKKTKYSADWTTTADALSVAIKGGQASAFAYDLRAEAFYNLQDYPAFVADSTKVLELDPQKASAWSDRCFGRTVLGELDAALSDCNRSLELNPNNQTARDNRALTLIKLKQPQRALADLEVAP